VSHFCVADRSHHVDDDDPYNLNPSRACDVEFELSDEDDDFLKELNKKHKTKVDEDTFERIVDFLEKKSFDEVPVT
jgi:hypothetical protein